MLTEAHAFMNLPDRLTAAHYREMRGDRDGVSFEGLVVSATHRAYSRTVDFSDAAADFRQTPLKVYGEANK
jgi:hypothetical protein